MRVVHVVTRTGTYGGERFVPSLARAQRACGIDASIATIYDSADAAYGVPVYSAGRGTRPGFFFRLSDHLRHSDADVIHTHLAHAKVWGRLAAVASKGVPLVHTEHGNDFGGSLAYRTLERILDARTCRIVAFSQTHAARIAQLEGFAKERIAIVPNGIDLAENGGTRAAARRALGARADERIVLFVGRLDPVKQPVLMVEAFALLVPSHRCLLRFAGDGILRDAVAARARELGIEDRVGFLGYRTDVAELLAGADAVANTSSTEAMPLSIVEALCAGVPVCTAPWPGAGELVADRGVVSAGYASNEIAAALECALRISRLESGPRLEEIHERFAISRSARAHLRLYESLLRQDETGVRRDRRRRGAP